MQGKSPVKHDGDVSYHLSGTPCVYSKLDYPVRLTGDQIHAIIDAIYETKPKSYGELTAEERKLEAFYRRIIDKLRDQLNS